MATVTNTPPDYEGLAEAVRTVSRDSTTAMQDLATAHTARTARLTAVRDRLQKNPKTPQTTVLKLNAAISATSAVAQNMGVLATRIAARPVVDTADNVVFGRVVNATGAPAPGLYVRLSDSAGSLKAGARVKTDLAGDFSLTLKSCEIPEGTHGLLAVVEIGRAHV